MWFSDGHECSVLRRFTFWVFCLSIHYKSVPRQYLKNFWMENLHGLGSIIFWWLLYFNYSHLSWKDLQVCTRHIYTRTPIPEASKKYTFSRDQSLWTLHFPNNYWYLIYGNPLSWSVFVHLSRNMYQESVTESSKLISLADACNCLSMKCQVL